ncbi:hypothetical protein AVEN_25473-1 [Araneus ventricosus]|uniref:Uncharacterized protein n=1 Tax=Araneus ventricosus TaxID=182803 RepID=A0A4Y2CS68_ARAVE|nr:hypothetical protein AVEN_25473-1 [Araneus ventricosus]
MITKMSNEAEPNWKMMVPWTPQATFNFSICHEGCCTNDAPKQKKYPCQLTSYNVTYSPIKIFRLLLAHNSAAACQGRIRKPQKCLEFSMMTG